MANDVPKWEETEEILEETPSWEETEEVTQAPTDPGVSGLESLARGAAQGITAGFQEEASTVLEPWIAGLDLSLGGAISGRSPEELKALIRREYAPGTYKRRVAEARKELHEARKAHPYLYGTGEIAGAIAGTAIPGGLAGKAATKAVPTLRGAATIGAAGGALQAAGLSEEEVGKELAKDIALGAATGGAFGVAGRQVGKLVSHFKKPTKDVAEEAAEKFAKRGAAATVEDVAEESTERGTISLKEVLDPVDDIKDLSPAAQKLQQLRGVQSARAAGVAGRYFKGDPQKFSRFGRELQELGIVKGGWETADQIAANADDVLTNRGAMIGQQIDNYDTLIANKAAGQNLEVPEINLKSLLNDVDDKVLKQYQGINEAEADIVRKYIKNIKNAIQKGQKVTLRDLQDHKKIIGKKAYKLGQDKLSTEQKLLQDYERVLNDHVEETLRKASEVSENVNYNAYKGAKRDYATAATAAAAAAKKSGRELNEDLISMGDVIAGTVWGAMTDSLLFGATAGIAKGLVRPRFPSLAASGLNKLSRMISTDPGRLGRYAAPLKKALDKGNRSLAATHYVLSQRFPDYRQNIEQLMEEREKQQDVLREDERQ